MKYQAEEYLPEEIKINKREYLGTFLIYDGDYYNGKRHGKGKEYNIYGKLVFDGEYLDGRRHGKGKVYNKEGLIVFEGDYINGKRRT